MSPTATEDLAGTPAPAIMADAPPYRPYVGRTALITGSGRGIGRGMALELASRGANIVVNYASSSAAAEAVVKEIVKLGSKAIAIQADISSPPEIVRLFDEAVAHFGKLDFVISNSGTEVWRNEEEVTVEDFDKVFNLNTRGQFFVAQQGLKHLGQGGRIILMSSIAASMSGIPNHALYAGSKAAVEGFARSFAVDCGHKGITVNAIAPGGVKTDMFDANAWHYVPNGYPEMEMEVIEKGIAKFCPLKRCGVPADIAKAVALLVSPDSEWINGESAAFLCGVLVRANGK
jgi:3-oxoacyl-[acyl-carrier protein] reductase